MRILEFDGRLPDIDESAFLADGCVVIGRVEIAKDVGIWFNAVLRGDGELIRVGEGSNIQDGAILHTDPGFPCTVGPDVTVGHNAILHGCQIEKGATIGMGATVLNGALVGEGALVAANALVLENFEIPPRTLVAGVPAKPRKELTEEEAARFVENTRAYVRRRAMYMKDREAMGKEKHG